MNRRDKNLTRGLWLIWPSKVQVPTSSAVCEYHAGTCNANSSMASIIGDEAHLVAFVHVGSWGGIIQLSYLAVIVWQTQGDMSRDHDDHVAGTSLHLSSHLQESPTRVSFLQCDDSILTRFSDHCYSMCW